MANFELRFTGLCTFSPDQSGARKVMLVNAFDHHAGEQAHEAALLAPVENVVTPAEEAQARPHDFPFDGTLAGFGSGNMYGFIFRGEDLTIKTLNDKPPLEVAPGPDQTAECPTPGHDDKAFGWVASLTKAEGARVNGNALNGKDPDLVLARLLLDRGTLSTESFMRHNGSIARWKYLDSPSSDDPTQRPRALAEVVFFSGAFSGSRLIIESTGFRQSFLSIYLKPDSLGRIVAWLVNMPHADIVSRDRTPGVDPDRIHHFRMVYRLSDKPRGNRHPHRLGSCDRPPDRGEIRQTPSRKSVEKAGPDPAPSNPRCPPLQFEP